jgi:hypothetical protein
VPLAVVTFAGALGLSLWRGDRGIRAVLIAVILVSPLRGGLLDLTQHLPVGDPDIAVNALPPALVAGAGLAALLKRRVKVEELPAVLVYAWVAIAIACALDFLTQVVGLKLYGIGLAQYLTFPTFAILVWMVMREESALLAGLFLFMGAVVAVSVFVQAAGITDYVQAAPPYVEGLPDLRYGGITGSYLHTSAFLGVTTVLAAGYALRSSWRWGALGALLMGGMFGAQLLTFSRSGIVIGVVGSLLVLIGCSWRQRARLVGLAVPAVLLGFLLGTLGGVAPQQAAGRATSAVHTKTDLGNRQRIDSMKAAVRRYGDNSLPKQLLGEGIASTGNARKLINQTPVAVESNYLKVLLETGLIGSLLIFPILIGMTLLFLWIALKRGLHQSARTIGAAGFAFSLHLLIFPTLEVQALAMGWWLLATLAIMSWQPAEASVGAVLERARSYRPSGTAPSATDTASVRAASPSRPPAR